MPRQGAALCQRSRFFFSSWGQETASHEGISPNASRQSGWLSQGQAGPRGQLARNARGPLVPAWRAGSPARAGAKGGVAGTRAVDAGTWSPRTRWRWWGPASLYSWGRTSPGNVAPWRPRAAPEEEGTRKIRTCSGDLPSGPPLDRGLK